MMNIQDWNKYNYLMKLIMKKKTFIDDENIEKKDKKIFRIFIYYQKSKK